MKRPVKKFLSFLCASAMLCNVPLLPSDASDGTYFAKQIGDGYNVMLRGANQSIYIRNGTLETATGGTQLVVIGDNGEKRLISLDEGIHGIYPYSSSTMVEYKFLSPTDSVYGFNYYDSSYQLTVDQQATIVGIGNNKYALMDMDGNIISNSYDSLIYLGKGFYATNFDSKPLSVIASDGTEVIPPNERIISLYLTADGEKFLIHSEDGDYFADLAGNPISDVYPEIMESFYRERLDFWSEEASFQSHNSQIYRFRNENHYYSISFGGTAPQTEFCEYFYSGTYSDPNSDTGYSTYICGTTYGETRSEIYYDLNGNQFSGNPVDKSSGVYYSYSNHGFVDNDGNVVIELPEDVSFAYSFELNDKIYYAAQMSGYFMVYDSSYQLIQPKIEGRLYNSYAKNWFYVSSEDGAKLYGTFDPENTTNPIIVEPAYEDYYSLDNGYWYAKKDDKVAFFDQTGHFLREFDNSYQFTSPDVRNIVLNRTDTNGETNSIIYDITTDTILYDQTGTYDEIRDAANGTMVVVDYDESDPSLWGESDNYRQGLLRFDGTEIIPMTDQFRFSLDTYGYDTITPVSYSFMLDTSYDEKNKNSTGAYIILRDKTIDSRVVIDMESLDSQYAQENGCLLASVLSDGTHAFLKNGKWRIDGTEGLSPEYDVIYEYCNGLAFATNYHDTPYTTERWNSETNQYEEVELSESMPWTGIVDRRGREIVAPVYDSNRPYSEVTFFDGTFYIRKPMDMDTNWYEYENISASDVFNEFTEQYGYDTAVKYGNFYVISKGGLKGIVTAENEKVIPLEYVAVPSFDADEFSLKHTSRVFTDILSTEKFSSPFISLENGNYLVNLKTTDGKIKAFEIQQTDIQFGDCNEDTMIDSSDAAAILMETARLGSGEMGDFNDR